MNVSAYCIKWEAQQEATAMSDLTLLARLVHGRLVHHCNIKTRHCFPSEDTLALHIGRSDRSVRKALKELQTAGVISIRRNQGRNGTNQYVLHILERKISASQPVENGKNDRQDPSAKQKKELKKEQALPHGRTSQLNSKISINEAEKRFLDFETVTDPEQLDEWHSRIGALNFRSPVDLIEMTRGETGYRLPTQRPGTDKESQMIQRAFFNQVLASGGKCFD